MVIDTFHTLFWSSQAAAAGTGLLCAMAFSLWVINVGRTSIWRLFGCQSAEEARGQAVQITAINLHIISAMLLGTNSLLAGILCALLFRSA
jgi:hypothetical protein